MATVTPTLHPGPDVRMQRVSWEGFAISGDVGTEVQVLGPYSDKTVQAFGTFTGGLAITWEGSLDGGVTWTALRDLNHTSLVQSAASLEGVEQAVPLIRPRATAGSGGADVDVWLFATGVSL